MSPIVHIHETWSRAGDGVASSIAGRVSQELLLFCIRVTRHKPGEQLVQWPEPHAMRRGNVEDTTPDARQDHLTRPKIPVVESRLSTPR
jgi:hypothetical protein